MKKTPLLLSAVATILAGLMWFVFFAGSHIRIQNLTGHNFADVTVMDISLGAIKTGTTGPYRKFFPAFGSDTVSIREANGYFQEAQVSDPGDRLWGGRYTYVLRVDTNRMLQVTVKKE